MVSLSPFCVPRCGGPCHFSQFGSQLVCVGTKFYCPLHAPLDTPGKSLGLIVSTLQDIISANGSRPIEFAGVVFPSDGSLHLLNSARGVVFRDCEFAAGMVLSFSNFNSDLELIAPKFHGDVTVQSAPYRSFVCRGALFPGPVTFNLSGAGPRHIDLSNSTFFGEFSVVATETSAFNVRNASFKAPIAFNFSGAPRVPQSTSFVGSSFGRGVCNAQTEATYRSLRQAFEANGNRDDEGIFYALEKRSQRRSLRMGVTRSISALYDWSSTYGSSYVSPLVAIVIVQIVAAIGYVIASPNFDLSWKFDSNVAAFTIAQVVRPFELLSNRGTSVLGEQMIGVGDPAPWAIWTAVHGVVTLVFFALFVLAVRWRFKRS